MKSVNLTIGGQRFQFNCAPENEKNLKNAAGFLNSAISDIQNTSDKRSVSLETAAIMVALNFAGEILDERAERDKSMQDNKQRFSKMIKEIETVLVV